eukprot:scaffold49724_cov31-Tisochrysis_lutea.AAC.1
MKSRPLTLTRQQWLRGLFLWAAVPAPMTQLLLDPAYATLSPAHASSPSLPPQAQEDRVTFRADDLSFEFKLPSGWVGGTPVSEERASPSHIIAVSAQKPGTTASLRAVVEGGSRGRNYGRSLADLGSVSEVAGRLVSDELFKDDDAKDAVMIDYEQVGYSLYLVGFKPAIAKLAICDGRLYYVKVKTNTVSGRATVFFNEPDQLANDMEEIIRSFHVAKMNPICLAQSNAGKVPVERSC